MELPSSRREAKQEGSYTSYLFEKGLDKILKKCGEESAEVIIAAKNHYNSGNNSEISDLLYHLTVSTANQRITLEEVNAELEKCSRKKREFKAVPRSG